MTERARKITPKHPNKGKKKHITHHIVSNIPATTNQTDQMYSKTEEPVRSAITKKTVTYNFKYVINDLKRIGIITGIMVVIIIILAIVY